MLCNRCVRELLILARTWFAFGLPSKTGCDISSVQRGKLLLGLVSDAGVWRVVRWEGAAEPWPLDSGGWTGTAAR
jgi:hypothetical protein